MSNYAHAVTVKAVWGGDAIEVQLHPLKFVDLLAIQAKVKDGEPAMLAAFYEMLPRYVISLTGANDAGGNAVTVENLSDAYWAGLVSQMMLALVGAATPPDPT